ncbi:MAG: Nramp family divalent metal transporter [Solirubrobacterales bacterium]|nr:Nramp family divalent metal transporter [Solirubrobacterales bacterium]
MRGVLALLGPAFVAAVAYVDPGNFATNFQAGAEHGYSLVWVVVMANLMAMLVQYLTSKLGLATGMSLPELCAQRFPRGLNALMWLQAEVIAMACDLAEFAGAAVGLNLVFGVPLFPAGLITAVLAFAILALQQRGYRSFEVAVVALLSLVALGFLYDFIVIGHQSYGSLVGGLVPGIGHGDAAALTVGIVGATVMPHVIYLHSSLQSNRIRPQGNAERRKLLRFNAIDCVIALGVAGLVNVLMLCVASGLLHRPGLMGVSTLQGVHSHMGALVGGGVALAFGVALIASGLAASSVGTYSGQVVMSGFMGWRIPVFLRRALTMAPALLVLGLSLNATQALVYSQVVLSFGIPFALVPLVVLTSRRALMGDLVNRGLTTALMWAVTTVICGLNFYLLASAL